MTKIGPGPDTIAVVRAPSPEGEAGHFGRTEEKQFVRLFFVSVDLFWIRAELKPWIFGSRVYSSHKLY